MADTANIFPNGAITQTLDGLFKETYAQKLNELIPDGVKFVNAIPFLAKEKQPGNLYHVPCVLGLEHGVTYASGNEDYFALNAAVAGTIRDAQVRGTPMVLRSILGYTAASRAAQGGAQSFMDATKFLVSNMLRSMTKKLEVEIIYGQKGLATVKAGGLVDDGAGLATFVVPDAEWASGIWSGSENMPINFRSTAGADHGNAVVKKVDLLTKTITLTVASAALPAVVATDIVFPAGAYGKSFQGIHSILSQATGTLFNIDVADYALFRGNEYAVGGASLSFDHLAKAVNLAVQKGLEGKVTVFVSPKTWTDLMTDQAALRKFDYSYSSEKAEVGHKSIKYFSQNGEMEIIPSIYVKEGYAYMLFLEDWIRVGSSDVTFRRPSQGDQFFRDMESFSGYELRCFTDQSIFTSSVGKNVLISGIVNA